jgi:hypothetical protein
VPHDVPRLREAVVVAELLAGGERILRSCAQVLADPAAHLQRAEAEQRAGRPAAAELERLLEGLAPFRDVARRPVAPDGGRQLQQQVSVAGLSSPRDRLADVGVLVVHPREEGDVVVHPRLRFQAL